MTEPQGQPDHESAGAPEPAEPAVPAAAEAPAAPPAAPPAEVPAKKAPATPPAKKAAKKAPAKKAAAKKAPAKKAPPKKAPAPAAAPATTNGAGRLSDAAKETAAQAKSTVDAARNPLAVPSAPSGQSPVPLLAAGVLGLFGLLLIRWLLRARRG